METVRAWLRGVEMSHYGDALFDAGYVSMARICALKDGDLLSVGVKRPEDRQIMLESIANINSLNSEASSKSDTAAVQVRETKDPKLLKTLLALASQLVSGERGKTTRVVVDRVERVRNDPLSIVFKRHSKTLEVTAGEETQIVQRLYVPLVDPYAQPQRTGASKSSGAAGAAAAGAAVDPVTVLVNDGFQSCVRDGAFGRGVYFPSELRVRSTDNKVFRAVCCDVAIGKRIDSGSSTSGGSSPTLSVESSGFDSVVCTPGVANKTLSMLREDLAVRAYQQVLPRFVVSFTLHSNDNGHHIWVVSADGSGDHRSISDAVEVAAAGDKIVVRPGTYCESVTLNKGVLLTGVGAVTLEYATVPLTLRDSNCQVSGVAVRLLAGSAADSVVAVAVAGGSPSVSECDIQGQITTADAAQLVLRKCRVTGSRAHGIHVAGKSTCLVEECVVEDVELCGVVVDGGSRGVIMNSTISLARQNGIWLTDGAKGIIEGCNIFHNAFPGIAVSSADPVIARNRIHHNERSGLMIKGKSEGLQLEDNNIFSNGLDGVMLANEAACSMQHNAIFDNRGVGIQILSRAAPHISQTSVYNNRGGGIVIGKTGNAHLSGCEVFANGGSSGICISKGDDSTVVVVQGCEVFSNTPYGIEVKTGASPKLLSNRVFEHSVGVWIGKNAAPVVEGNEIFSSTKAGVYVCEGASPSVTGNTTHTNVLGIHSAGACSGAVLRTQNSVSDNLKAIVE